jgi:hypothetical protein
MSDRLIIYFSPENYQFDGRKYKPNLYAFNERDKESRMNQSETYTQENIHKTRKSKKEEQDSRIKNKYT